LDIPVRPRPPSGRPGLRKPMPLFLDIIARPCVLSNRTIDRAFYLAPPEPLRTERMNDVNIAVGGPDRDLAAVKSRQQRAWASGDFSVVASRIVFQAEHLCETADIQAGWCVLDVATGSGNAAIAAARRGCE